MNVAAYYRTVVEDEVERDEQRRAVWNRCEGQGYTIVAEYSDRDAGASDTMPFAERPAAIEVFGAADRGEIDKVVMYRLNCISRDMPDALKALVALREHEVDVETVVEAFDDDTSTAEFARAVLSTFTDYELKLITERLGGG